MPHPDDHGEAELDPEERADLEAALAAEAAAAGESTGEISVRIHAWGLYIVTAVGFMVTLIVARLSSPGVAALMALAIVVLFVVARRRRVRRYRFDEMGQLYLNDDPKPLGWSRVALLRVRYWSEPLTPDTRFTRPSRTLDVRFEMDDGTIIRFARGDHFETAPARRVLRPGRFERWLQNFARDAGLVIETVPGFRGGWDARRGPGDRSVQT